MNKLKIFVGYNERMLFESIEMIFNQSSKFEVIGGAENPIILNNSQLKKADILVIEIGIPSRLILSYIAKLQENYNTIPKLLISSKTKNRIVTEILETGISGYILKSCSKSDLINAATMVASGSHFYCHTITEMILNNFKSAVSDDNHVLTNREIEVLKKLVNGDTNNQIAIDLNISETTVKTHRKNIMSKLEAKNLLCLIRYACRENLIDKEKNDFCESCPCKS